MSTGLRKLPFFPSTLFLLSFSLLLLLLLILLLFLLLRFLRSSFSFSSVFFYRVRTDSYPTSRAG